MSSVDRITYATDTDVASVRGPLNAAQYILTAVGNQTYGWFAGGGPGAGVTTITRITYATDTATASVRGPLSVSSKIFAAAGTTTDGWFGGGGPGPSAAALSTVQRITYATDTDVASVRGPLSKARNRFSAASGIQ